MSAEKNEIEIRELIENWTKAIRARDMEGILANHSNDIVMFDVPVPMQSKGIDEYKATWEFFFRFNKGGENSFRLTELKIFSGEDTAFAHSLIKLFDFTCRLTMGFKKINGKWMIVHEHHSAPFEIKE
jgi:ketosteroid isomerase-like protein